MGSIEEKKETERKLRTDEAMYTVYCMHEIKTLQFITDCIFRSVYFCQHSTKRGE